MISFTCLSGENPAYFSEEQLIRIGLVRWYKLGNLIYLLAREAPFDGEVKMFWPFVMRKIPYSLYRNDISGFYHA